MPRKPLSALYESHIYIYIHSIEPLRDYHEFYLEGHEDLASRLNMGIAGAYVWFIGVSNLRT